MAEYRTHSDEELLRRARRDPDAFCAFYDRHVRRLFGWLSGETLDAAVAAELTAETFAQALRSMSRFRGDSTGSARAWLYRIARRLLVRHRTKGRLETRARHRLRMPTSYEEEFAAVEERVSSELLRELVAAEFTSLPGEQREAVRLRVIDELSYDEIGARLACTPGAARTRVSRALRILREHLSEEAI